jgi:arginine-glutamic acid dipeptide repeat-containing protein
VALHAGVCMHGHMKDGYMAASSDETTQQAFDVLHQNNYNTEDSLLHLVKKPIVGRLYNKKNWSKEHSLLFAKGMRQFGKNFRKIKKELLPNKEIYQLIEYYYYWKKTTAGLSSRSTRKQRKQFHIRMCRSMLKGGDNNNTSPEREFSKIQMNIFEIHCNFSLVDLSSGDEEDMEEDGEKCFRYVFTCIPALVWYHWYMKSITTLMLHVNSCENIYLSCCCNDIYCCCY